MMRQLILKEMFNSKKEDFRSSLQSKLQIQNFLMLKHL